MLGLGAERSPGWWFTSIMNSPQFVIIKSPALDVADVWIVTLLQKSGSEKQLNEEDLFSYQMQSRQ